MLFHIQIFKCCIFNFICVKYVIPLEWKSWACLTWLSVPNLLPVQTWHPFYFLLCCDINKMATRGSCLTINVNTGHPEDMLEKKTFEHFELDTSLKMGVAKEQVILLNPHLCLEWCSTDQGLTWRPVSLFNSVLTERCVASREMFSSSYHCTRKGANICLLTQVSCFRCSWSIKIPDSSKVMTQKINAGLCPTEGSSRMVVVF